MKYLMAEEGVPFGEALEDALGSQLGWRYGGPPDVAPCFMVHHEEGSGLDLQAVHKSRSAYS